MRHLLVFGILFFAAIVSLRAQERLPDSVKLELRTPPALHKFQEPGFLQNPSDPLAPLRDHEISSDFPKTWSEFKAMFLAMLFSEEFVMMEQLHRNMKLGEQYQPSLWFTEEEIIRNNTQYAYRRNLPVGGMSVSVFQELYDLYSHEGKMKRKYDSLIAQDEKLAQVSRKYDIELVKKVTGFADDKIAQEFMDFCNFKNDSILQANQYEVYNIIYDCLTQFVQERN